MNATTAIRRIRLQQVQCDGEEDLLAEAISRLLQQVDAGQRPTVWRHAYWRMPDVPDAALRAAAGGEGALRALAGAGPPVGWCAVCGRVLRAGCRAAMELPAPRRCHRCTTTGHAAC